MKALKTAALVVGAVALIATGVGAAASAGLLTAGITSAGTAAFAATAATVASIASVAAIGLSLAAGIIAKPSQGGSQTKWKPDPYAGLPYPIGRTLVGGNIVLRRGHGSNNVYQTFVTVLGLTTAQSIDATFLNKTTVPFNSGGAATGTYSGQVWQRTQLGACPEPAALSSPVGNPAGWTSAHKLSGMPASILTLKYDSKTNNGLTSEPAPGWIGHWAKVWDPRLDSTYPGGSGSCRALQEDTYGWSEDPHLHALTWILGRWQNGKRVAGIGAPLAQIDVARYVEGANLNTARNWKVGGQVVTRPDTLWNSLKAMLQAGGATPVLIGGMYSCVNRAPRVSLATITRSDIVGRCTFSGTQARRTRINGIIPQYRSEAHDWEMVSASAVSIASFVTLDGDERTKEVPYPLVQDVNQVAQLATYDIYDAREAGPGSIPLKPWWLNYRIGDCVTFSPEDGYSIKTLITGRSLEAQSGVVTYEVCGETDAKHAYALGQTGTAPPIVSLIYSTGVAAPAVGEWGLAAGAEAVPTLHVTGAVGNPSADAVFFEYRKSGDTIWLPAGIDAPTTTDKIIPGIGPGEAYEVAVSYRVRGVIGARSVLGPATSGDLVASSASSAFTADSATTADTAGAVGDYDAAALTALEARIAALGG